MRKVHQRMRDEGLGTQTGFMKLSEDGDAGLNAARRSEGRLNWRELLRVENGGPGEVPGREEAVKGAIELSVMKSRRRGRRKKR